ncbi:MAG: restriction endonuclease subunit S [Lachnospiraceae bacterium]|nr:restriction endonuclease subunit S [Lachnospiraceae bacterium]
MAREMKDSGIEWIGEIPKNWDIKRLKYLSLFRQEKYDEVYGDLVYIGLENVESWNGTYIGTDSVYDKRQSIIFQKNDILWGKLRPYLAKVYYCTNMGCCSSEFCVISLDKMNDIRFFWYLLISPTFIDTVNRSTYGTKMPRANTDFIKNMRIPIPSIIEQSVISRFLDNKSKEIDNILIKTRASIEEYKKLKQAVITQAVTKGIRGDREMKDSGVEWIGNTPIGWKLIPFRHVLKERQEKNSPIKSVERLSLSIDLGVTLYAEKTTNLDRFKDDFEQYKLAYKGDLVMNSMNMIVGATGVSDYFGCVSPVYYTFYDELEDHVTAKYCEYIFRSKTMLRVLYSLGKGIYAIARGDDRVNTCRLKVSKEDLKSIVIPVPPIEEQREIVSYLKNKCEEIDKLIAKKEQYLSEVENYKKSMIYEYVTGKKQVL